MLDRRQFLAAGATAAIAGLVRPAWGDLPKDGVVKLGVITDVHQDIMHDGVERIGKFVAAMNDWKPQAVLQLGDFCVPHARNETFLAEWNRFAGPKRHTLGNHDTDGGFKREKTVEFYGMPARYYSVDQDGLHLVVLDGNDPEPKKKGYPAFVAADQLKWLTEDLSATKLPTVVCIHQPIDGYNKGVTNAAEVRAVLADANKHAGYAKVLAVLSGHCHLDYVHVTDGIPHLQVNSASYVWTEVKHATYDAETVKKHPYLAQVCPYVEPLWAGLTIDFAKGEIEIAGRTTEWKGGDPWQIGLKEDAYQRSRELSRPGISSRVVKFAVAS